MPLLEIRNLKKIYRTPEGETLTVLDVPEFALEERQQLVLRGASGTGKTTFLNCIAGILRPDNGSVRLNGTDMAAASEGRRDQSQCLLVTVTVDQGFRFPNGLEVKF